MQEEQNSKYKYWFFFSLLFLVIDYGRPQDLIPIGALRPGMISTIILLLFLTYHVRQVVDVLKFDQLKYFLYLIFLLAVFVPFAKNNYYAYMTMRNMALFFPFLISIAISVNSIKRLKVLINSLLLIMLYIAFYSMVHHGKGSGAYFVDENDLSLYINTYIPFAFFLMFYEKAWFFRAFYFLCFIVGIIAVINSDSRGGFLGLGAVFFVIWLYSPRKFLSALLLILLIIITLFNVDQSYIKEMETISNIHSGTANERILSWKAAWKMFVDNPLGVGGGNFMIRFPEYQGYDFSHGMWGRAAHSLWFTLLPELGVIGVYIYIRLLYSNIKNILQLNKTKNDNEQYFYWISLALIASFAGFFTSATFLSVLYYPHYYYLSVIIVIACALSKKDTGTRGI